MVVVPVVVPKPDKSAANGEMIPPNGNVELIGVVELVVLPAPNPNHPLLFTRKVVKVPDPAVKGNGNAYSAYVKSSIAAESLPEGNGSVAETITVPPAIGVYAVELCE